MEDTKTKKGKTSKKVARAKKTVKTEKVATKETKKVSKMNDGKCCRCTFRNKENKCSNKKSEKCNSYVPRKFGCDNFKYAN